MTGRAVSARESPREAGRERAARWPPRARPCSPCAVGAAARPVRGGNVPPQRRCRVRAALVR
eukprot:752717-Prymnesium_polylepis.1